MKFQYTVLNLTIMYMATKSPQMESEHQNANILLITKNMSQKYSVM